MAVTDCSQRQWGEPDIQVRFTGDGRVCTGFIDARRRRNDL